MEELTLELELLEDDFNKLIDNINTLYYNKCIRCYLLFIKYWLKANYKGETFAQFFRFVTELYKYLTSYFYMEVNTNGFRTDKS